MKNIRISSVEVTDSTTINAIFTENLTPSIGVSNVKIISQSVGVDDSRVISVKVNKNLLKITCQPLIPYVPYNIQFNSTDLSLFKSVNGDAILLEDGVGNVKLFLGPMAPDNPVRNFLKNFLRDNIYNTDDSTTLVSKFLESFVNNASKALYDTRQLKNENYLNVDVIEESKSRGSGPYDRLNEESAYEVTRVALSKSGNSVNGSIIYRDDNSNGVFPSYPVTLQQKTATQILYPDSVNDIGKFNINDLIINLDYSPVISLKSVRFLLNSDPSIYDYNIEKYGYQIQDNKYDQQYAYVYVLLNLNQIKLSSNMLSDPNFALDKIIRVEVEYQYKDLGKLINQDSVSVQKVNSIIRESLPPIINIFDLKHAPIVNDSNQIVNLNGVTFTNADLFGYSEIHPAFISEIPFNLNALPSQPGQYSIDYNTGRVYVFGENSNRTGTGPTPPLATYKYRFTYQPEVDYVFDYNTKDLVSLPNGSLRGDEAIVDFNYEQVLVPEVDYVANVHKEILQERINNNLLNLGALRVSNYPVTDVFRIYNETSGEIYSIERWDGNKIYFNYVTPPKIVDQIFEKVNFENIVNEVLFVSDQYINVLSTRIFQIKLKNNTIVSSTEDSIGSFINSSAMFSNITIFSKEKYYVDEYSAQDNYDRLSVGEYCIDYANGIVYVGVESTQDYNVGAISYKKNNIVTNNNHIISVNDIYYQLSDLSVKGRTFTYNYFEDHTVMPNDLQKSLERYYNNNQQYGYVSYNYNGIDYIGYFTDSFNPEVTDPIKFLRGIYENEDLLNNSSPINFATVSSFNDKQIELGHLTDSKVTSVISDIDGLYVELPIKSFYISNNINFDISIRDQSNNQLWDTGGIIEPGEVIKLRLSGAYSPVEGQVVTLQYDISIKNLSSVGVDYNKGDMYIDYTYLADEIIVSYEYGDNVINFQKSTLPVGTTYYVSYKVGALRNALLTNFGDLSSIEELNSFNVTLNRERYRDALGAVLTSSLAGPTSQGIKNLVKGISHITPEIIESVFQNWSLGNSLLYPQPVKSNGEFNLQPGKYGSGPLIKERNNSISLPGSSNISITEGTFESWIVPEWNGIDNLALLDVKILKNGSPIDKNLIFVGEMEEHPSLSNNTFKVSKPRIPEGLPNRNKDGVYIYHTQANGSQFEKWNVEIIGTSADNYTIEITTDGNFYNPSYDPLLTGTSTTTSKGKLKINVLSSTYSKVTFIADYEHYLFDYGDEDRNRLSIFKDVAGYLNFRVIDKNKEQYTVSADISSWTIYQKHHVAASWKLNTDNNRDELHLFIDGFEVPNIVKYGQQTPLYLNEKFRTIDPAVKVGFASSTTISANDLSIVLGSPEVVSSINFNDYGIVPGDTLLIDDPLYSPNQNAYYGILAVNGNTLTLDTNMSATLDNLSFIVNPLTIPIDSDIGIYSNIAVSKISSLRSGVDLNSSIGSPIVTSASSNFETFVSPGYILRTLNDDSLYYITDVISDTSLQLDRDVSSPGSNIGFIIYSNNETEIPGIRAVNPSYEVITNQSLNSFLAIKNDVSKDDILFIRTLGLNYRNVNSNYYLWGEDEHLISTRLPPPISLDQVEVTKFIFPSILVNSSNSQIVAGIATCIINDGYGGFPGCAQPSNNITGRTLQVTLTGNPDTVNVDFGYGVTVVIDGYDNLGNITETLTFNDYQSQYTVNKFGGIYNCTITCKPILTNKSFVAVSISEKEPMTIPEDTDYYPIIKYSYQMNYGKNLYSDWEYIQTDGYDGYVVRDDMNTFSYLHIGNTLYIQKPASAASYLKIVGVSEDRHSAIVYPIVPPLSYATSFTDGYYQVLNATDQRTGLQNGLFSFEKSTEPGKPYSLSSGHYNFKYYTYLSVKIDPVSNKNFFIGNSVSGQNQIDAVVDETKIYSIMLTDTRIGESIPSSRRSVTKDFNSLIPLSADKNTTVLIHYDSYPFTNAADFYKKFIGKNFIQSNVSINDNFDYSATLNKNPIILDNDGILNTLTEGTIEFWVSPFYDTDNDPNYRYYFDAYGAKSVEATSINNSSVSINEPASSILSVTLKNGDPSVDYFAGGKLEINNKSTISETITPLDPNIVNVSKSVFQVISVKVVGDYSNTNYFENGVIGGADKKTIYLTKSLPVFPAEVVVTYKPISGGDKLNSQIIRLNKPLPKDNSSVIVKYMPKGFQGDRLSIFKDPDGRLNFTIKASGTLWEVSTPIYWSKDTWHRVKASYKVNSGKSKDEMRLFIDGYERSSLDMSLVAVFGDEFVVGGMMIQPSIVNENIIFKDFINQIYIGSDYSSANQPYCLLDNLRISSISRPIYSPYGEAIDPNYSSNLSMVLPVTEDLYTTYLLNFDHQIVKNEDFAFLLSNANNSFDFTLNIFDSFGIVSSSDTVKQILEKAILMLKPANSRAFIRYYS